MPWSGSYEELLAYLRQFVNVHGDPVPYDFNGVVDLMLATLDNLGHNALEAELEDMAESFSDEQAAFFLRLADYLRGGVPFDSRHSSHSRSPGKCSSSTMGPPSSNPTTLPWLEI